MSERRAQDVLDYWFGGEPLAAGQLTQRMRLWFGGDEPPEILELRDETLAERFGPLIRAAAAGALDSWAASPRRLLALVILLDQFPRSVYRGTAQAFAQDERALSFALQGLQTGADATLAPVERIFLYMPLEHAEASAAQEESVAAFRRLAAEAPVAQRGLFESCLRSAQEHQAIIARFGRFPHRNAALGREASPAEIAYLAAQGQRFGQ